MDNLTPVSNITIQERRTAEGLDRHVPIILRDGIPYDADLDRLFLDLPLNGVRSPHSLRAYGYDIAVWVRFLHAACGKTVWAATRVDVDAFHRARRREDAGAHLRRVLEPQRRCAREALPMGGAGRFGRVQPVHPSRGLAAGIWEPAGLRCCAERFL